MNRFAYYWACDVIIDVGFCIYLLSIYLGAM